MFDTMDINDYVDSADLRAKGWMRGHFNEFTLGNEKVVVSVRENMTVRIITRDFNIPILTWGPYQTYSDAFADAERKFFQYSTYNTAMMLEREETSHKWGWIGFIFFPIAMWKAYHRLWNLFDKVERRCSRLEQMLSTQTQTVSHCVPDIRNTEPQTEVTPDSMVTENDSQ